MPFASWPRTSSQGEPIDSSDVARDAAPSLAASLAKMRQAHAAEFESEDSRTVVLHTENDLRYGDMVAVMDAIAETKDPRGKHGEPEFRVNLAVK